MLRTIGFSVLAAVTSIGAAPALAAGPGSELADVAAALRADPVYVDPAAERTIDDAAADRVRTEIREAGSPIYLAVLPDSTADRAGGDPNEVARLLARDVGRPGTYGIVVGDSFRAGSTELPAGEAAALASAALASAGDDTVGVLVEFVDGVRRGSAGGGGDDDGQDGGSGTSLLPLLLLGGLVAVVVLVVRGARRRRREAIEAERAEEADRQLLRAELSVLADDVLRLDHDVQLHPAARSDYDAAVTRYRVAQAALDEADEPLDLVRVERVVAEARYSMARAVAIVQGREPPPPPPDLQRPGRHGEPAIALDDDRQPTYVGYPGGFQGGGWFGGVGGGLFSGLLLGSMLGGFGGWGFGGSTIVNVGDESGGDDFGAGDFGGGDFGGGDFGGGDFGGGDF